MRHTAGTHPIDNNEILFGSALSADLSAVSRVGSPALLNSEDLTVYKIAYHPCRRKTRSAVYVLEKIGRGERILNLRPPGPETKETSQGVDFSIHVSGASTVQTHVIPVRRSHSFSYGCPRVGAPEHRFPGAMHLR